MTGPWLFPDAERASDRSSSAQLMAETFVKDAFKAYAVAEEKYRVALARRIVEAHDANVAWTACADIARGDKEVARLRRERDIAEGVKEAAQQAAWRASADRRDTERLIGWSARADVAQNYHQPAGPANPTTYGRRQMA